MRKKILLGLAAILAAVILLVAAQPSEFRVTRSASMAAPAPAAFARVNDLHAWESWSPWEKIDPAMKRTFEGPSTGAGAVYKWSGNAEVGEGSMTIIESRPHERVKIELEFVKPMPGTNITEFTFEPKGNQTLVTWTMTGRKNFVSKAVCLFLDMDQMIGGHFEQGLAAMKSLVEADLDA